jgi:hypothetical protein
MQMDTGDFAGPSGGAGPSSSFQYRARGGRGNSWRGGGARGGRGFDGPSGGYQGGYQGRGAPRGAYNGYSNDQNGYSDGGFNGYAGGGRGRGREARGRGSGYWGNRGALQAVGLAAVGVRCPGRHHPRVGGQPASLQFTVSLYKAGSCRVCSHVYYV